MSKKLSALFMTFLILLVACKEKDELDGLKLLEVDFEAPEIAEVDETVTLKAFVTYGDDPVTDARQMDFEVWERGKRDEGEWIKGKNHKDGTYTAEVTFDRDGIFEMYAHTTAHDLHTMPHREIIVGDGGEYEDIEDDDFLTEGFDLSFFNLEDVKANEEIVLEVHIFIHDEMLESAKVRYEIWSEELPDHHEWIDAEETDPGQYSATYTFPEESTYFIQIHVEDNEDLHEHKTYEIEVSS